MPGDDGGLLNQEGGVPVNEREEILRELEEILDLHSWFPKTPNYPALWKWYKGMKWGSTVEEVKG